MNLIYKKNFIFLPLVLIVFFAFFVRIYKIDSVPPSISWDEAAVGYNAYTIANWGRDEWGNFLPLVFKSFEDDKRPVHIYITAFFVKIFLLNEFSTRLPAAIFGTLNVVLVYMLAKLFFNKWVGFFSAVMMAISPYSIQFSRFNHELNFMLFFFLLGLFCFYKGLSNGSKLIPISFLFFGIAMLTYHSALLVIPLVTALLFIFYIERIFTNKENVFLTIVILLFFGLIFFLNPSLNGLARVNQSGITKGDLEKNEVYLKTKNENLAKLSIIYNQYLSHFSLEYLLRTGDKNARHSSHYIGEFYLTEIFFLVVGVFFLIIERSRKGFLLLFILLISPLPAALVKEAPHAARAGFMLGSLNIISAFGLYKVLKLFKNKYIIIFLAGLVLMFNFYIFGKFLHNYFTKYSLESYHDWQYGMKQIVDYVEIHPEYFQVYMTDARSQPYIFFLYYLKTPLPEYLETVQMNDGQSRSYNLVSVFDRYYFGIGDPIEYVPTAYILQILEPSKYSGLRYKDAFDVKKFIEYPDGGEGYYIVTAKN